MTLTVEQLHIYTKDHPELNILLEGNLQSSNELVSLCMELCLSDFNSTPPVTEYDLASFPNQSILLYGTLHHLCNSEAERQLRNQVTFNAQGVHAGIDDKSQLYMNLSQYYKQLFDSKVKEFKTYLNMEEAWGGLKSPYSALNPRQYRS